ncbi:HfaB protein, partial [Acinetobacter sp. C_4_1]|nr:HfaB protein [Acinetobacter sp. C_4_1]MCT8102560.1 HfaB protein [Acinetobacter sp. C_4_1]MCT8136134.1 HfaB protein [Acinetobacter sp. T_3_1]MCT8136294.1 HfaB protein [Acinetobacter sp. T_3_1]
IENPEGEPETNKQDLIKYISMKKPSSSLKKMNEEKDNEKTQMLWDVNPEVVENYWSSTQRD